MTIPKLNLISIKKKIIQIPRIYKLLFYVFISAAAFSCLFYFLVMPQLDTKKQLQNEYEGLRGELTKMIAIKKNIDKFRADYKKLQELLQDMLKQLPETKDIPNLLRNITIIGGETRVKLTYFEPKEVQSKEFYSEMPFVIRYSGPYYNIGYFFDSIRRLDRIINIQNFNLSIEQKTEKRGVSMSVLAGECTAKTYVYLKEQVKKEKKDAKK